VLLGVGVGRPVFALESAIASLAHRRQGLNVLVRLVQRHVGAFRDETTVVGCKRTGCWNEVNDLESANRAA
jgi:hypothetical protein